MTNCNFDEGNDQH